MSSDAVGGIPEKRNVTLKPQDKLLGTSLYWNFVGELQEGF